MSKAIRVRYEKGVLQLLDDIELREGEELEVVIVSLCSATATIPKVAREESTL